MTKSSFILLKNVRFHAYHGVLEQEQTVGNDYELNLELAYDFTQAMETDDLRHTISYAEVYQLVAEEMAVPSKLLEHVAGRIVRRLFRHFPAIIQVDLEIVKRNPPMGADCDGAGVRVCLTNDKTNGKF